MTYRIRTAFLALVLLASSCFGPTQVSAAEVTLKQGLEPYLRMLTGREKQFTLSGDLKIKIDGKPQLISLRLARFDGQSFDLELTHSDYALEIRRREDTTLMILPKHGVAFRGNGPVGEVDSIAPSGILSRLVSHHSEAYSVAAILSVVQPEYIDPLIAFCNDTIKAKRDPISNAWHLTSDSPVSLDGEGQLAVAGEFGEVKLKLRTDVPKNSLAAKLPSGTKIVDLERTELERTISRGVHRATEVFAPGITLQNPKANNRKVQNGELRWIKGQRVAILHGTPEEIGTAHALLLREEATRCIESVLYSFATVHAIRTGRWFRHDLHDAYARLAPHIPDRHKRETHALASGLGLSNETLDALNVFPELFHCSGFAVFDSATKNGKLYHGRVLDYMTTIGLQDAATTFIIKPDKGHAFANIGYAAFIGSVSGMNSKAISLGEMGGGGEGKWDGVPMATLMRRALEECSTLDDVIRLWSDSPRTCEYYYVFADGKTNEAVGVAAYPESIEFIKPGQSHERLGSGIPDAVVLSAGSRLEKLRERVKEKHGQIDADVGKWLMSRPVAMQSNLHNVLFVPQDGVFYVANASHSKPAAERPYVRLSLPELLKTTERPIKSALRSTDSAKQTAP